MSATPDPDTASLGDSTEATDPASTTPISQYVPRHAVTLAIAAASLLMPVRAHAVDGCLVLLCLAAPNWRAIPPCVPPIRQLLRELARGKAFPSCTMAGAGNSTRHTWASAPGFCPPQYTRTYEGPNGPLFTCDYSGAISVVVQGVPFATTWWSPGGETSTDFSAAAKTQLGSWDTRFEDDYARWLAAQPVPGFPFSPHP